MAGVPERVGILFCDVVGSTRLYRDLGDELAHRIVEGCLAETGREIAARGGRVVKTIGDEIMAVFPDASGIVEAAIAIQNSRCCREEGAADDGVRFRIGFHVGPVVEAAGDVFGTTVNVAARMASLAKADQIITTVGATELLGDSLQAMTRPIAGAHARGVSDDIAVAEVLWQHSAMQTLIFPVAGEAGGPTTSVLKLLRDGRRWMFERDEPSVTLGRAPENTVVVGNARASRQHATIERRWDRWMLIDHSTNGTFVRPVGAAEFCICREEIILHAAGTICLGQSAGGDREDAIDFVLNAPA